MTKAHVVMGNDFPDAVYEDEDEVKAYIEGKKEEDKKNQGQHGRGRIHWRYYSFDLKEKGK